MVAGYGSWAKTAVNPAAEVVAELKKTDPAHYRLHCLEIPVNSQSLYATLERALLLHKPDLWIGVGVAVSSPAIRVETIGLNVRYFDVPDNNGEKLEAQSVLEGGALAYQSTLPHDAIVNHLRAAKIPAAVSFHAGTHLCNQMLYSVLDLVDRLALDTSSGFLHVPQSTDNVALADTDSEIVSSMSIPMMTKAVQIAVDCSLQSRG